jgi:hypothetical protein
MKQLLLLCAGITGFSCLSAQSLSPQVIASAGNSFSTATCRIEFTIGEVVTASLTAGGNTLTQGFHQPEIHFSALENYTGDYVFTLYPNPTEQFVTVESTKRDDMRVHLFDALGKSIQVSSVFQEKITIDLQTLAAGSYILMVTTQAGQPLHSYTVIKKSTY